MGVPADFAGWAMMRRLWWGCEHVTGCWGGGEIEGTDGHGVRLSWMTDASSVVVGLEVSRRGQFAT